MKRGMKDSKRNFQATRLETWATPGVPDVVLLDEKGNKMAETAFDILKDLTITSRPIPFKSPTDIPILIFSSNVISYFL